MSNTLMVFIMMMSFLIASVMSLWLESPTAAGWFGILCAFCAWELLNG